MRNFSAKKIKGEKGFIPFHARGKEDFTLPYGVNQNKTTLRQNKIGMESGFTFLFAALVSSIVLAIGLGLVSITAKQQILSSTGRESVYAFFSADGGGECSLMWDLSHPGYTQSVFPTSTASTVLSSGVVCNSQDLAARWTVVRNATSATTTFPITFGSRCTFVTVAKTNNGLNTSIIARGYNLGTISGGNCVSPDPKRVERALRIFY